MFDTMVIHVLLVALLVVVITMGVMIFFTKHIESISSILILLIVPIVVFFAVGYLLLRS